MSQLRTVDGGKEKLRPWGCGAMEGPFSLFFSSSSFARKATCSHQHEARHLTLEKYPVVSEAKSLLPVLTTYFTLSQCYLNRTSAGWSKLPHKALPPCPVCPEKAVSTQVG